LELLILTNGWLYIVLVGEVNTPCTPDPRLVPVPWTPDPRLVPVPWTPDPRLVPVPWTLHPGPTPISRRRLCFSQSGGRDDVRVRGRVLMRLKWRYQMSTHKNYVQDCMWHALYHVTKVIALFLWT